MSLRTTVSALPLLILGCAPTSDMMLDDDAPGSSTKGFEDGKGPEVVSCWVEPGDGDVFNPDVVLCSAPTELWNPEYNGRLSVQVSYNCGITEAAWQLNDEQSPFVSGTRVATLIVADNTCPNGAADSAYPVDLRFSATNMGLIPSHALSFEMKIVAPEDATFENPAVVQLPVETWDIEIDNQLVDRRAAEIRVEPYVLDLGAITAQRGADEPTSTLTFEAGRETYRRITDGSETITNVRVPVGLEAFELPALVRFLGGEAEEVAAVLDGPGRYVLSDAGLIRADPPAELPEGN